MRYLSLLLLTLFAVGCSSLTIPENGFTDLFADDSLDAWMEQTNYTVKDGVVSGKKGSLFSKKAYSDFHLKFEFRLQEGSNNGLAIRTPMGKRAIELQIIDNSAEKYKDIKDYQRHGSLYNYVPAKTGFQKPVEKWNQQEVICKGSMITVILNGTVIMEADLTKVTPITTKYIVDYINTASRGHIGFLGHNSPIEFRKVRIKELR